MVQLTKLSGSVAESGLLRAYMEKRGSCLVNSNTWNCVLEATQSKNRQLLTYQEFIYHRGSWFFFSFQLCNWHLTVPQKKKKTTGTWEFPAYHLTH